MLPVFSCKRKRKIPVLSECITHTATEVGAIYNFNWEGDDLNASCFQLACSNLLSNLNSYNNLTKRNKTCLLMIGFVRLLLNIFLSCQLTISSISICNT